MSLLPASSTEKEYNETCWEFLCFLSLADDLSVGMKHGECQRGWSSTVWQRKVGCDQEVNKDKAPSLTWNFIAFPWDVTWQKMSEMIFPSHPQGPVGINFTITPSRARSEVILVEDNTLPLAILTSTPKKDCFCHLHQLLSPGKIKTMHSKGMPCTPQDLKQENELKKTPENELTTYSLVSGSPCLPVVSWTPLQKMTSWELFWEWMLSANSRNNTP